MTSTSPLSCIFCGYTITHPTAGVATITPNLLPSMTKDDDISNIIHEVARLDQQIELLRKKRASFLNRLNDIQSRTNTIPPEVLSYIMEIAAANMPPINERDWRILKNRIVVHLPLTLSAVSSHWRQVAHSTPRIWTSLRLELDDYIIQPIWEKSMVALLRYYFERARNLPLSLAFGTLSTRTNHAESFKPVFDVALRDNPTKIKALYSSIASLDWSRSDGNPNIYPQLQILDLSVPSSFYMFESNFELPILPALQRLTLRRAVNIKLSTTTITYLHLTEVPYDSCNHLLLACQETLVEFHCAKQLFPLGQDWSQNNDIYTIPRLETIRWDMSTNVLGFFWDTFMFEHFNLPSLQNISLFNLRPCHTRIYKLFSRVTSTLSGVCISTMPVDDEDEIDLIEEEDFVHLLDFNTRKLEIRVDGCSPEVLSALHALTPSYRPERQVLVPGLRMLSLSSRNTPPLRRRPSTLALDEASNQSAPDDNSPSDDSSDVNSIDEDSLTDDNSESDNSSNSALSNDDSSGLDSSDNNLSDAAPHDRAGEILCSAILKMLEDRLLPVGESSKTPKDPFILALSFKSMEQQNLKDYERELHALVQAGVLRLTICENAENQ